MKHELALAVVVAVGLGVVGATVAVGSSVREQTVVANPYEAGLHHGEAVAAQRAGDRFPAGVPVAAQRAGDRAPAGVPGVERACDLAAGPCARPAGPYDVTLDLGPRPLRTMAELAAVVEVRRGGAPVDGATVVLAFDMRGMSMGENRRTLAGAGSGRYTGTVVLVRCPSGRKDWIATLAVDSEGTPAAAARFELGVVE
jgi:hypothetical protein